MTRAIRPIRTEADYEAALREINRLWGAKPDTPEGDRLEVLGVLVECYEKEHFPIDAPTAIEAIAFRIEQMGLGESVLEPIIGSRTLVHGIMTGRRQLTLEMIRRLHDELDISADVLIRPSRPDDANETSA